MDRHDLHKLVPKAKEKFSLESWVPEQSEVGDLGRALVWEVERLNLLLERQAMIFKMGEFCGLYLAASHCIMRGEREAAKSLDKMAFDKNKEIQEGL